MLQDESYKIILSYVKWKFSEWYRHARLQKLDNVDCMHEVY